MESPVPFASLFGPPPALQSPIVTRARLRERRHACSAYIRKVKGEKYQLRWWLEAPQGGSINCGLYNSEWEAERVRGLLEAEMRRTPGRGKTAISLWLAMQPLIASGVIPVKVLPKYVRKHPEGGYVGQVKRDGVALSTEVFASPEEAHRAMMELLKPVPVVKRVEYLRLYDLVS